MTLRDRFLSFVTEQQPFAAAAALKALDSVAKRGLNSAKAIDDLRPRLAKALRAGVSWPGGGEKLETTPGVSVKERRAQGLDDLIDACDGFIAREAIAASLTDDE